MLSIDPSKIKRGRTESATTAGELRKDDLIGALIVVKVTGYDAEAVTQYGTSPQVDCDVLVVDGVHAGTQLPDWRTFGLLARQIGEQGVGEAVVGRVTSGSSKQGRTWVGFDVTVSEADFQAAVTAAGAVADAPAPF